MAMLVTSPPQVIAMRLGIEEEKLNLEPSLRLNKSAKGSFAAPPQQIGEISKELDLTLTQENEMIDTVNDESVPSVKQIEGSIGDCSHLLLQDTNLSAANTTGATVVKVTSFNSHRNLAARPVLLTANGTTAKHKNFHGIDEIPDETSALGQNKMAVSVSNGRWSSDIQDETLTLTNSLYGGFKPLTTSAFVEQDRQ